MVIDRTPAGRQMRLLPGALHTFEMVPFVRALRGEGYYLAQGHDGVTLVSTPELRLVLEALRAGRTIDDPGEAGLVILHLLDGELRLQTGEEILYLHAGEVLAMPSHRPHSLEAVRDSAFLLTLGIREKMRQAGLAGNHLDWREAQERFRDYWPPEAGDEQC